jgi:hypothetical protein
VAVFPANGPASPRGCLEREQGDGGVQFPGDLDDQIGNDGVEAVPRIGRDRQLPGLGLLVSRRFVDSCQRHEDLGDDEQRKRHRQQLPPGNVRGGQGEDDQRAQSAERGDGHAFAVARAPGGKEDREEQEKEIACPVVSGEIDEQKEPAGVQPVEKAALDVEGALGCPPEQNHRIGAERHDGESQSLGFFGLRVENEYSGDDRQHDAQAFDQTPILVGSMNHASPYGVETMTLSLKRLVSFRSEAFR